MHRSLIIFAMLTACGDADFNALDAGPFASEVVGFSPGEGAGFGQNLLPNIVLGAPRGIGEDGGGIDVLSLGRGGELIVGFGERVIVDGPGDDLVVFENAFYEGGDPERVFAELGEVSVLDENNTWHTFPCTTAATAPGQFPGCAGWRPVLPADGSDPDPGSLGGDPFDLADLGVSLARQVRIRDISEAGEAPTAGFDVDAVGMLNIQ